MSEYDLLASRIEGDDNEADLFKISTDYSISKQIAISFFIIFVLFPTTSLIPILLTMIYSLDLTNRGLLLIFGIKIGYIISWFFKEKVLSIYGTRISIIIGLIINLTFYIPLHKWAATPKSNDDTYFFICLITSVFSGIGTSLIL